MRHIAIISPHFLPSNLAGAQRARLIASCLPEFNWRTTIITVDSTFYEEKLSSELERLVSNELKIIRVEAFGVKPVKLIGDIGIRGFTSMYRAVLDLHKKEPIDFVYITVPSFFASLLGRCIYRKVKILYGIDYQDPWVIPGIIKKTKLFSKRRASHILAKYLEPVAIKYASLITGVSELTYKPVLNRNQKKMRKRVMTLEIPIGYCEKDFEYIKTCPGEPFLWNLQKKRHYIFAGSIPDDISPYLHIFLNSLIKVMKQNAQLLEDIEVVFVGTGSRKGQNEGLITKSFIKQHELNDSVVEYPERIGYIDVLRHLVKADGVIVLGSTTDHYTPSKIFQSIYSNNPIFAILNKKSTAVKILKQTNACDPILYDGKEPPNYDEITSALKVFLYSTQHNGHRIDAEQLAYYSSRTVAKSLANTINELDYGSRS